MEEMAAVSCAVQNIYLALNTFGIGGYWSSGKIMFSEEARTYLDVKGEDVFMGFFLLGKVKMDIPPTAKDSVVSHVIWKK
jgi:nitroreductase